MNVDCCTIAGAAMDIDVEVVDIDVDVDVVEEKDVDVEEEVESAVVPEEGPCEAAMLHAPGVVSNHYLVSQSTNKKRLYIKGQAKEKEHILCWAEQSLT